VGPAPHLSLGESFWEGREARPHRSLFRVSLPSPDSHPYSAYGVCMQDTYHV
jgi:hypothetical protein